MNSRKPTSLGSKARSFIPMTPRSLKPSNNDPRILHSKPFTASESTDLSRDGEPPHKKFKSTFAPKGTKLAAGYVDRTQQRLKEQDDVNSTVTGEDKQKRLQALEEMLKLQQIDQATFENLRDEIGVGGSLESTHLVKGLDFKLLERVRRGEDVNKVPTSQEEKQKDEEDTPAVDIEAELERELEKETGPRTRSEKSNGNESEIQHEIDAKSTTAVATSLTRDELLRRLKQNRKNPNLPASDAVSADPEPPPPSSNLDHSRFRKLEAPNKPNKRKFTETINGRRREVLVITDKEGNTKRKTRWLDPEPDPSSQHGSNKGKNSAAAAWGSDLPAEVLAQQQKAAQQAATDDIDDGDDDIFGGVKEYDPLADIDSGDEEEPARKKELKEDEPANPKPETTASRISGLKSTTTSSRARNYFGTTTTTTEEPSTTAIRDVAHDPSILAALKRAAQIRIQDAAETETETGTEAARTGRDDGDDESRSQALLKKLQQQSHQDDLDMDMGFGGDTKYDEEDEDDGGEGEGGRGQKLSEWRGTDGYGDDDDDDGGKKGGGGGGKRKRGGGGGKKKKGDKNSVADVMSVLERRKAGS